MYKRYVRFSKLMSCFLLSVIILAKFFAADAAAKKLREYTISDKHSAPSLLYFQGKVQPLKRYKVITPIDGLISQSLGFNYGADVKKGQYLFSVKPSSEQNTYRSALLAYLRAKSTYSDTQTKFSGQQLLYKNGILARNSFLAYQRTLVEQKLAQEEALFQLRAVIEKSSSDPQAATKVIKNLQNLSIANSNVETALARNFAEVKIYAPAAGIALAPKASSSQHDNLGKNSAVKLNKEILTIGDFSGLKMNVNVSEMSINELHTGLSVAVTGPAFTKIKLKGYIKAISYEATADDNGGLPAYPITIVVPKLTVQQRKIIHVGMTAYANIKLSDSKKILVPIEAVHTKDDKSYVLQHKKGKVVKVPVKVGKTTLDKVVITQGLQAGDKILY